MADTLSMQSPAKINLTLDVLDQDEESGYHRIQTIFQRINLFDELEFTVSDDEKLEINSNRRLPEDNTIKQAYDLFCEKTGKQVGIKVKLKKLIPSAAGLGGASGNAATMLLALNHLYSAGLETQELMEMGVEIGMDVPFFLSNYSTAFGTHFGEKIFSLPPFPSTSVLIFFPKIKSSSQKAYQALDLSLTGKMAHKTDMFSEKLRRSTGDVSSYLSLMHNDFEEGIFEKYPEILKFKESLLENGLEKVVLSGSGSSLYGFGSKDKLREIRDIYGQKYLVFVCETY
jgi:4-diphosphocytidyl-2-C-methyl-D-erythritol kinase